MLRLLGALMLLAPQVLEAGEPSRAASAERIVTLGGAVTEIVYALGAGDRVVGVDASSSFPRKVKDLAQVAYHRRLNAEGVLSLNPDLVVCTTDAGPPAAIEQLQASGVRVVIVEHDPGVAPLITKIRTIARLLDRWDRGEALIEAVEADLAKVQLPVDGEGPRVLFLMARGQSTLMVAGTNTAAAMMIELAGGVNAVDGYEGYKPLTAEAAVLAVPDVVLLMSSGLEAVGGVDALLKTPGLALTPAGQARRIEAMDGLFLLGFGPRTGKATHELHRRLFDENGEHEL